MASRDMDGSTGDDSNRSADAVADSQPKSPDVSAETRPRSRVSRRRLVLAWSWVALWAMVIWVLGGDQFSLSETSHTFSPWIKWLFGDLDYRTRIKIFLAIRKFAHFFEYAVLALLTFRAALLAAPKNQLVTAAWVAVFLVATLATADEARQALSTTRSGSPYDVLIDITGGSIAVIGLLLISRRMRPGHSRDDALASGTLPAP